MKDLLQALREADDLIVHVNGSELLGPFPFKLSLSEILEVRCEGFVRGEPRPNQTSDTDKAVEKVKPKTAGGSKKDAGALAMKPPRRVGSLKTYHMNIQTAPQSLPILVDALSNSSDLPYIELQTYNGDVMTPIRFMVVHPPLNVTDTNVMFVVIPQ